MSSVSQPGATARRTRMRSTGRGAPKSRETDPTGTVTVVARYWSAPERRSPARYRARQQLQAARNVTSLTLFRCRPRPSDSWEACVGGSIEALMEVLAPEVVPWATGGE
jgi:hypothetical protein